MKKFQKMNKFACLFVAFGLLAPTAQMHAYNSDYATQMANEALKAYDWVEEKPEEAKLPQSFTEFVKAAAAPYRFDYKVPSLASVLKRSFENFPVTDFATAKPVIDSTTVVELELLRGGTRSGDTFIDRVTSTGEAALLQTVVGRQSMIEALTMPVDDMAVVQKRQAAIKALTEKNILRARCLALLQKMKEAEPYLSDMYMREGLNNAEEALYPNAMIKLMQLGESPAAVTFANRLATTVGVGLNVAVSAGLGYYAKHGTDQDLKLQATINAPLYGFLGLIAAGDRKRVTNEIKRIQQMMIHVATFIRSAQALFQLVGTQPGLLKSMPEISKALDLLQGGSRASSKFIYLNNLLRKSTFDEGAPSALSSPGNVLVAYKYMTDKAIRAEFAPVMRAAGEIDTYVALAQKMVAHKDMPAQFCFAEFVESKEKPLLDAQGFWNPFIDPQVVVPNNVSLGTGAERNLLISGPNTGGKSTVMKALMMSVLMAQTYGIAPAESIRFTPFSKLITYLNIADDTGAGISLFKAEVKRASELMATLKALPANQFAFVMIDEIFTGTAPDKAEQLSHQFMSKLSEMQNVIFVNATHFKKLTDLEQQTGGQVKNYHTGVITDDTGRVVKYTYKLVPGPNVVSSAQQVAEESGIEF